MEKATNYLLCAKCGGACCKENGCTFMPEDFRIVNFKTIKKEIEKGDISISGQPASFGLNDWTFILYLRARNIDADIVDLFTSGGPCQKLLPTGCGFPEDKRPSLGLAVKPTQIGGPCEKLFTSEDVLMWLKYYDVLEGLVKHYTTKEVYTVVMEQLKMQLEAIKIKKQLGQELSVMDIMNLKMFSTQIQGKNYIEAPVVKQRLLK